MPRPVPTLRFIGLAVLVLLGFHPSPATAVQPPDPDRPSKLEWMVQERIFKLDQTLGARPEKRLAPGELAEYQLSSLRVDAAGRLFLTLRADEAVGEREAADLRALGAAIEMSTADILPFRGRSLIPPGYGAIDAWVPYDRVEAAGDLPWVTSVAAAEMGHGDAGSVTSEGVRLHRANVAQAAQIDGSGVTIGVISPGANHIKDSIASGDLPKNVILLGGDPGDGDEGTAMMEVVHDMAPGAKLVFHPGRNQVDNFIKALRAMAIAGVDILAEDIAFDREPAFAQGIIVHATQEIAKAGIAVFGSAGNLANGHAPRIRAVGSGRGPGSTGQFTGCPSRLPNNVVATFDVEMSPNAPIYATLAVERAADARLYEPRSLSYGRARFSMPHLEPGSSGRRCRKAPGVSRFREQRP